MIIKMQKLNQLTKLKNFLTLKIERKNTMEPIEGTAKTFNSGGDFGLEKLSKANELNETMSIAPQGRDTYESKLFNIGGNN